MDAHLFTKLFGSFEHAPDYHAHSFSFLLQVGAVNDDRLQRSRHP